MNGKFVKMVELINKSKGIIILAIILIAIVAIGNHNGKTPAGSDEETLREKTAWEQICEKYFPGKCEVAVVADQDAPGAYCTGILAHEYNAPVLFTDNYEAIKDQLERLSPDKVFFATSKSRCDEVVSYVGWSGNSVLIDTDSTINAGTVIASNLKNTPDQVFVIPYDASKEVVAAVSPVSSKRDIPILAVSPEGFCDQDREFILKNNIKKAWLVGEINENATGFLDYSGIEMELIDGTNTAEINGKATRLLLAESKSALAVDDAMQAVSVGALNISDSVLYLPEHIDATQIEFCRGGGRYRTA
ncbi:MAG: hypothetical protein K5848_08665 [Lachnospiraceae bacterium]|nr:hypothetical protein [Lachnospiraceae bacterium]